MAEVEFNTEVATIHTPVQNGVTERQFKDEIGEEARLSDAVSGCV